MTRAILVTLAAGVVLLGACSGGGGDTTVDVADAGDTGISVVGVGEVFGVPDTLTLTIGVQVTESTVELAGEQAAASAAAVIDALVDEGVDREDIQTQQFRINPEYDFIGEEQRLTGYTVTNTVVVKLRDVDSAGETIDAAVSAGGDDIIVRGVGFSVEDDAERIAEARERAWNDAEAKAQDLAGLAGIDLGPAVQITEGTGSGPVPAQPESLASADASFAVPIESGEVASTVTIVVRFAIEP